MAKRKRTKGQTKIYNTLRRKLKIEQCEPYKKDDIRYSGSAVRDPLVAT
jgi:hypothetical protein